jgi:hypothetical protein
MQPGAHSKGQAGAELASYIQTLSIYIHIYIYISPSGQHAKQR